MGVRMIAPAGRGRLDGDRPSRVSLIQATVALAIAISCMCTYRTMTSTEMSRPVGAQNEDLAVVPDIHFVGQPRSGQQPRHVSRAPHVLNASERNDVRPLLSSKRESNKAVIPAPQQEPLSAKLAKRQATRTTTDAGVDVSDPELYTGVDLHGDSSTATVMGLATGYAMDVYERFVGSLRKTGYKGHIILGVAPDVSQTALDYFAYRNVTPKILKWVDCQYNYKAQDWQLMKEDKTCVHPYVDIKSRWSRFPLQRDWLKECETCTGPVLIMDVRDSVFQRDPFGPGSPVVHGLQVFEERKNQTTEHWLTKWPIKSCKGIELHETMLCSGTTIGTRKAMIRYLEVMYAEMQEWIKVQKCRFRIHGDDQSIHNYLFYTGQLPFATAIPNRSGGIVHTVGVEAAKLWKAKKAKFLALGNYTERQAAVAPYDGANGTRWLGKQYNLIDDDGYITDFDGSKSRVVHQFDRFGVPFIKWLRAIGLQHDPLPKELKRRNTWRQQQDKLQ